MNNLKVFEDIKKQILINEFGQIFVKNKPIVSNYLFKSLEPKQRNELIIKELSNIIYDLYYCKSMSHIGEEKNVLNELKSFAKKIKRKVTTFKIDFVGEKGLILASNSKERRLFRPGEYFLVDSISIKEDIKIAVPELRFYYKNDNNFCHFSSHHLTSDVFIKEIRIYVNFNFLGISNALPKVFDMLKRNKIEYKLKTCMVRNEVFRPDNTVLYFDSSNLDTVILKLKEIVSDKYINPNIPFFTKKISEGLSWAESPHDKNISFGMSRSGLIAEYLFESLNRYLSPNDFLESRGLKSDELHLFY